jgi:curved DNA-binding protein CbpA
LATGITWYDVLGITAGASSDTLRHAYTERIRQLAPELVSGEPSPVVSAATRARDSVEAGWLVLGDRERRHRYDTTIGLYSRHGLNRGGGFGSGSTQHGVDPYDLLRAGAGLMDGDLPYALEAMAGWMAPLPIPARRRLLVPDVRGLFYRASLAALTAARLKPITERLTPDPQPVEGLVVAQSPVAGSQVRHKSMVTVQVWHPSRPR